MRITEIRRAYVLGEITYDSYQRLMHKHAEAPEKYIGEENWKSL